MPEKEYTLAEAAEELRRSPRTIRTLIYNGAEHTRSNGVAGKGSRITFTESQLAKLQASLTPTPVKQSMTTGRRRAS